MKNDFTILAKDQQAGLSTINPSDTLPLPNAVFSTPPAPYTPPLRIVIEQYKNGYTVTADQLWPQSRFIASTPAEVLEIIKSELLKVQ